MKKKIILSTLCIFLVIVLLGCKNSDLTQSVDSSENSKINVTVSFYPLKEFTEAIGKDKVSITCLIPSGMEPHDYEPKTKDFEKLIKSDLFVYNGFGLEHWVDTVTNSIKEEKVKILDSSSGVEALSIHAYDNSQDVKEDDLDGIDPHIWLSLKQAQVQCENIKNALIEIDEENKDFYESNFESYKGELEALYNEYEAKLANVSNKDFITGHAAFGYLCKDFGLEQRSVENVFGEGEPTPKQLEQLVEFCRENNIETIFAESLSSPKVSQTLASEVGAKVVPIYTLESEEDGKSYLEAMRYNLEEIYKSLS